MMNEILKAGVAKTKDMLRPVVVAVGKWVGVPAIQYVPRAPTHDEVTVREARAMLLRDLQDGTTCPVCSRFAKRYRRTITDSMAYALCLIAQHEKVRAPGEGPLHVPSYLQRLVPTHNGSAIRGGDWAKLIYWGLIEPVPGERDDGSTRNGYWKITPAGVDFVENRLTVPKYALIYDGILERLEGESVSIVGSLGERFNYEELMAR